MVYWVSFSKTGIGEVIRERSYDSIVKARRYAVNVLKTEDFQWASIHKSKNARYHIETIDLGSKNYYTWIYGIVSRYDSKSKRFIQYVLNADGTLGKELR